MKYADARSQIKTGDMLLWSAAHGGGLRAIIEHWIVRHGTASPYTHVGLAWVDNGRVWVMDITTKGCAPRLLSEDLPCYWSPAPRQLSEVALHFAFSCFGQWKYSRWQAILGALKRLMVGADAKGQCAEYALACWRIDDTMPTDTATPAACGAGALDVWQSSIQEIRV